MAHGTAECSAPCLNHWNKRSQRKKRKRKWHLTDVGCVCLSVYGLFLYYYPNGQSLSANQPREELEAGNERAKTPPPQSVVGPTGGRQGSFQGGEGCGLVGHTRDRGGRPSTAFAGTDCFWAAAVTLRSSGCSGRPLHSVWAIRYLHARPSRQLCRPEPHEGCVEDHKKSAPSSTVDPILMKGV